MLQTNWSSGELRPWLSKKSLLAKIILINLTRFAFVSFFFFLIMEPTTCGTRLWPLLTCGQMFTVAGCRPSGQVVRAAEFQQRASVWQEVSNLVRSSSVEECTLPEETRFSTAVSCAVVPPCAESRGQGGNPWERPVWVTLPRASPASPDRWISVTFSSSH